MSSFVTLVFLPWLGSFLYFETIDALTNYSFNQDIHDPVILQTHHRYVESLRFGEITYRSPLLKTERVRGVDSLSQQQSRGGVQCRRKIPIDYTGEITHRNIVRDGPKLNIASTIMFKCRYFEWAHGSAVNLYIKVGKQPYD